jgi:uncharacterized membrane-anchored protein
LRAVALRGATVAQHRSGAAQFARQYDQSAVEVDPRPEDLDRPGNADL